MPFRSKLSRQLAPLQVLVVDDNAQMRSIVGTILRAAGVGYIHYAADGVKALETIADREIDVIYVDYEMPMMNGLQFISAIRSVNSSHPYIPIIMLTGHSDGVRLNEARDRGVTEFLCKPVTANALLKRLEAVIAHPRPFVDCETYFGPDRRRHQTTDYSGPLRRASDRQDEVELAEDANQDVEV
jgi:CheY-like chemotaxis protein